MITFKNKNVVLFGNAKSVFNKERDVDNKFDIICRINAGFPQGKEQYLGSRTDILFLSLALSENETSKFNCPYIIICSPIIFVSYLHSRYNPDNWEKLYVKLKARPSTGLMAFDYILRIGDFKTLTLIGFDFWKTPNWYTNNIHLGQHNPEREKKYIEKKIEEYKDRIKIE